MAETDVRNEPQQTDLYWQDRQSPFSRATFPNSPAQIPSLKALHFPQRFSVTSSDGETLPSHVSCQRQHLPDKGSTHENHASPLRALGFLLPFHSGVGQVKSSGQDWGLSWGKEKCIVFPFFLVKTRFMVDSAYIHIIMPRFYLSPWPPFPHICWSPSFPHVVCFCFFDIFLDLVCPSRSTISTSMSHTPPHTHGGGGGMLGWGRQI